MSVAPGVLRKSTQRRLESNLGPKGLGIVESWAASNPQLVKQWEADGTLFEMVKEATEQAASSEAACAKMGWTHLATHEIYEMFGGPNLKL